MATEQQQEQQKEEKEKQEEEGLMDRVRALAASADAAGLKELLVARGPEIEAMATERREGLVGFISATLEEMKAKSEAASVGVKNTVAGLQQKGEAARVETMARVGSVMAKVEEVKQKASSVDTQAKVEELKKQGEVAKAEVLTLVAMAGELVKNETIVGASGAQTIVTEHATKLFSFVSGSLSGLIPKSPEATSSA